MRSADLLGLSLGALRQQKARTVLTTLGVVFGGFALVVSLSLGQGVQRTIERESHRNVTLRGVDVYPRWEATEADVPPELLQVKGEMSDEKRQRLRKSLLDQRLLRYRPGGPRLPLDRDRLQALAALEHVTAVTPQIQQSGYALFHEQAQFVQVCSAAVDNNFYRHRLVAGEFFHTPTDHAAVVSEFLCYQLGLTSEAQVVALVGQTLRLEFRSEPSAAGLHVYLYKADGDALKREETAAMEKLQAQLPTALDRLNLTSGDKDALRAALSGPPPRPREMLVEEVTVVGVLRQATEEDRTRDWSRMNMEADVLLPAGMAQDIFFKRPDVGARGIDYASLTVDREENVRDVIAHAKELGLRANAPLEYIDRERLIYLLIFGTMSCVAAVALIIAGLGIANTMLMSVLERTREIGIFKAVGASDSTVQLIFLIEGACLGLAGGLLGLLLAWAFSFPADAWIRSLVSRDLKIELKESLFVFPPWLTVGAVAFALLVTTLAAIYPARRAARVEPLKALRHE